MEDVPLQVLWVSSLACVIVPPLSRHPSSRHPSLACLLHVFWSSKHPLFTLRAVAGQWWGRVPVARCLHRLSSSLCCCTLPLSLGLSWFLFPVVSSSSCPVVPSPPCHLASSSPSCFLLAVLLPPRCLAPSFVVSEFVVVERRREGGGRGRCAVVTWW